MLNKVIGRVSFGIRPASEVGVFARIPQRGRLPRKVPKRAKVVAIKIHFLGSKA